MLGACPCVAQCATDNRHKIALAELACTHVHSQRQRLAVASQRPFGQFQTGHAQYERTELKDEAGILCQRNELLWRDSAPYRVVPARQGFIPEHLAVRVDNGLIHHADFVAHQGQAQFRLEPVAFRDGGLHGRIKKAQKIASVRFGLVHGQISTFQQFVTIGISAAEQSGPDTGCAVVFVAIQVIRLVQCHQQFLTDPTCLNRRLLQVGIEAFEDDDKLIATQPCHGIHFPHTDFQALGHPLEQQITSLMAFGVVQLFEVVQVDEQQGRMVVVTPAGRNHVLQAFHHQLPVGQLRQHIKKRQLANGLLRGLSGRDVVADAPVTQKLATAVK